MKPNTKKGKKPSLPENPSGDGFQIADNQRRIRDVASARAIYDRFVLDSSLRIRTINEVRAQLEGGLPYDQSKLEAQGAGWQTNVNFGDAQAARDRTLLPYWKLVHDVPHKIAVDIDTVNPNSDRWSVAISEAFDDFLADWGADYFTQYMSFAKNFVDFGPGVVQWEDYDSPRFSAVNVQRIYFPKNARMSPSQWDVVAMVRDVSPSELYLRIKDQKARKTSKDAGWNLDAVEEAIYQSMYGNSKRDPRDMTRVQDDIVQNDVTVASIFEPLQLVWLYVRQFTGEIGCYVFTRQGGVEDFLFENESYCEDFRRLLGVVWYDTGTDGLVHSIKGFGIKNCAYSKLLNRMKSRMVDSATMSFGINFQRGEEMPDEAPPIENYGPVNVIPNGLTQVGIYPRLQEGMAVIETLSQNQAENNALYRQQQQSLIQKSDTATQANILAGMSGELTEASASIYLSQVGENVFSECVRRLRRKGNTDKDAKAFVRRLREKRVPDEIIFDVEVRVRTAATAGLSSPMLRAQKAQAMLGMMNIPGVNGRYWLEQYIANNFGSQAVTKGLLPEGAQSNPQQRRAALLENMAFGQGTPLPVDQADAHFEHAEEHLKPMEVIAGQFMQTQQISPEQGAALLIGIEHTGQHMAMLKQDNTQADKFQALWPAFSQIQTIAKGVIQFLQQQQQEQGQPQQ